MRRSLRGPSARSGGEVRVAPPVPRRPSQPRREREGALQIESRVVLVREADRAVELDRLAGYFQGRVGAAGFRAARQRRAPAGIGRAIESGERLIEHRARELLLDMQIDRPVLQRLEAADRLAELLARAQVVEAHLERAVHDAEEL